MSTLKNQCHQYKFAILNLEETITRCRLENGVDQVTIDAMIRRFKICMILAEKNIKMYLKDNMPIKTMTPKKLIKEAYRVGVINNTDDWLDMLDDKNKSIYAYNEIIKNNIINNHYKLLNKLSMLYNSKEKEVHPACGTIT